MIVTFTELLTFFFCVSFYGGNMPVSQETNCTRDHFQFSCLFGATFHLWGLTKCVLCFPHVPTMVWLSVFGIFNISADRSACNCLQELSGHLKGVCTDSWLWEKNALPYLEVEPSSTARWTQHWIKSATCLICWCLLASPVDCFHPRSFSLHLIQICIWLSGDQHRTCSTKAVWCLKRTCLLKSGFLQQLAEVKVKTN